MAERREEGVFADINGEQQWLTLRGDDPANPAILMLNGPGAAFGRMAPFFAPLECDFTLIQWDQPGSGSTYAKNGSPDPFTFDRLVHDGTAVAEEARARLGKDKLTLLGISGGSVLGLRMVKERPDLFGAYVGTGQIVNWARQEKLGYEMALAEARASGNAAAVKELEGIGAPPCADFGADFIKSKYVNARTPAEVAAFAPLSPEDMAALTTPPTDASYVPKGLAQANQFECAMKAYTAWRPQLWEFDAYALGTRFDIPMHFIQGDRDLYTVTSEVEAYHRAIEAPQKSFQLIEGGGHSAIFMRDAFLAALKSLGLQS